MCLLLYCEFVRIYGEKTVIFDGLLKHFSHDFHLVSFSRSLSLFLSSTFNLRCARYNGSLYSLCLFMNSLIFVVVFCIC